MVSTRSGPSLAMSSSFTSVSARSYSAWYSTCSTVQYSTVHNTPYSTVQYNGTDLQLPPEAGDLVQFELEGGGVVRGRHLQQGHVLHVAHVAACYHSDEYQLLFSLSQRVLSGDVASPQLLDPEDDGIIIQVSWSPAGSPLTAAVTRLTELSCASAVSLDFFCSLCFSEERMSRISLARSRPCLARSWIWSSLIASSLEGECHNTTSTRLELLFILILFEVVYNIHSEELETMDNNNKMS